MGKAGVIVGIDLLPMEPLSGVDFIQGDFTDTASYDALEAHLEGHRLDLVLSDLAPNMSGVELYDQARVMALAELALDFALDTLKLEGAFLVKVFHGVDFDDFVRRMKRSFKTVVTRKPAASRDRSPEVYLLGRNVKPEAVVALQEERDSLKDFPQDLEISV
jgi:23S rRNA (uridine2552-2'-O)-methyltransferase